MLFRALSIAIFSVSIFTLGSNISANAKPGRIISATPERVGSTTVTSMVYESTGMHGEPIRVSGFVVVPDGPPPVGGRPIVAWARGTVGVAPKCGPSLQAAPLLKIAGLEDMLQRGFIVTASDFPGLGLGNGPHPFIVGESEGRAVLDSVRAARIIAHGAAGNRFIPLGYSQGGHAALFAGKMAALYAPELKLEGIATYAPATDISKLIQKDINTPAGKVFTSYALWSWSRVYGIPLDPVIAPPQQELVNAAAQDCNEDFSDALELLDITKILKNDFLLVDDLSKVSPWKELMKKNTPPTTFGPIPMFVAQGASDQIVSINVTNDYVLKLCAGGTPVDYFIVPGAFHAFIDAVSAPAAVSWITARFAGQPTTNWCGSVARVLLSSVERP